MQEPFQDPQQRISVLEQTIERQERELYYQRRVLNVLVAVGALTDELIEKAREIVSSFD